MFGCLDRPPLHPLHILRSKNLNNHNHHLYNNKITQLLQPLDLHVLQEEAKFGDRSVCLLNLLLQLRLLLLLHLTPHLRLFLHHHHHHQQTQHLLQIPCKLILRLLTHIRVLEVDIVLDFNQIYHCLLEELQHCPLEYSRRQHRNLKKFRLSRSCC